MATFDDTTIYAAGITLDCTNDSHVNGMVFEGEGFTLFVDLQEDEPLFYAFAGSMDDHDTATHFRGDTAEEAVEAAVADAAERSRPCARLADAVQAAGLPLKQAAEAMNVPYSRLRAYLAMAEGSPDGTGYAWPTSAQVTGWVSMLAAELKRRAGAVAGRRYAFFDGDRDQRWDEEPVFATDEEACLYASINGYETEFVLMVAIDDDGSEREVARVSIHDTTEGC